MVLASFSDGAGGAAKYCHRSYSSVSAGRLTGHPSKPKGPFIAIIGLCESENLDQWHILAPLLHHPHVQEKTFLKVCLLPHQPIIPDFHVFLTVN